MKIVTVPVGTDGAKTVEIAGRVIETGDTDTVTVVNHEGIGVVHELAGTETIFELGTYTVEIYGGTQATVATTTKLETSLIVAMLEVGTLLIAHSAETTTGLYHVEGTEIVTAITENDDSGTV